MALVDVALFLAAGLLGGVVNVLAGGAKLFVFPILLASGLPPIVANATGTVAVWPAQLPAVWLYRDRLARAGTRLMRRVAPALVGALCGALALILATERAFLAVIPFVLVGAVVVIVLGGRTAHLLAAITPRRWRGTVTGVLMFATGFYGGFFGAGMGFLILAVLTLGGVGSIHDANAEKNLTSTAINTAAVVPLVAAGLVHIPAALVVAVGGILGGYLGGQIAGRLPDTPMRLTVAGLGLVLTLSFLFG